MKKNKGVTLIEGIVVVAILVIIGILVFQVKGCGGPSDQDILGALDKAGFTEPKILKGGLDVWVGEGDIWVYHCEATNPQGKRVSLKVTWDSWKGATIRY